MISRVTEKSLIFIEKYFYLFALIELLILLFNLYYNLNIPNLKNWDESRHGSNAFEMLKQHNLIVNYYRGMPDYWNLKPSLANWLIMMGYQLFGYNALGLRFFSGLCMVIIEIALILFMKNRYGSLAALITGAAFLSCAPIILNHCGRTGDPDAVFLLFFTLSMLSLMKMDQKMIYFYLSGLFFAFAFLAKSWHAMSIVIIIGLVILCGGKLRKINIRQYGLFFLCAVLPVLLWALARYFYDGMTFFKAMIQYDLLKRSTLAIEHHREPRWFYFHFILTHYTYWFLLVFGTLTACLTLLNRERFRRHKSAIIPIFFWLIIPFIIYTLSKTKIFWYIYPIFPVLAICAGLFTARLIRMKKTALTVFLIAFLALSFYGSEKYIVHSITRQRPADIQLIFQNAERDAHVKQMNVYLGDRLTWQQSTYLSALLYGQFKPQDGGLSAFARAHDNKSLLLLSNNVENKRMIASKHYQIVMSNTGYYLIKKK